MKTNSVFALLFLIVLTLSVVLPVSFSAAGPNRHAPAARGGELPEKVALVIQKACMDCHSNDGSALARGKLNFSKWTDLDTAKQAKKAKAICKELTKGDMPPKKWRANNAANVPTEDDVTTVCNWANDLK